MSVDGEGSIRSFPGVNRRIEYLHNKMEEITSLTEGDTSVHYSADIILVQLVMALSKGLPEEKLVSETLETWAQWNRRGSLEHSLS